MAATRRSAREKTIEATDAEVVARSGRRCDPLRPETFPRRVLFAVTGKSPQVVTETVYALAVRTVPPFLPTEVCVATTREGAQHVNLTLLSDEPGWFKRLCADYGIEEIQFDGDSVRVMTGQSGAELHDIRTTDDNEAAADFITEQIRELTSDDDCALHVSIAGGRKTMGYYAGYALSLFGRPQDRLSHVLVSEPFETNTEFFYPTPGRRVIYNSESKPLDAHEAEVTLAPIPFVSLRRGLPQRLLDGKVRFSEAVDAAKSLLAPPSLEIDLPAKVVLAGGVRVKLSTLDVAFLAWMAECCLESPDGIECPPDQNPNAEYAKRLLGVYGRVAGEFGMSERTLKALRKGMDKAFFEQHKSKVNGAIRDALDVGASPYLIAQFGSPPYRTHGLRLPPSAIRITG